MAAFAWDLDDLSSWGIDGDGAALPALTALDNDIHPIFRRENWLAYFPDEWIFDCALRFLKIRLAAPRFNIFPNSPNPAQEARQALELLNKIVFDGTPSENFTQLSAIYRACGLQNLRNIAPDRRFGKTVGVQEYRELSPVLRLASQLLEHSLPFLRKLFIARRETISSDVDVLEDLPSATDEEIENFRRLLAGEIADKIVLFKWKGLADLTRRQDFRSKSHAHVQAYATTRIVSTRVTQFRASGGTVGIGVDTDYLMDFLRKDDPEDLAAQHRRLFQAARTLVHEVAHAVYRRNPEMIRLRGARRKTPEPYHHSAGLRDNEATELGLAIESYLFGGLPRSVVGDFSNQPRTLGTSWKPTAQPGDEMSNPRGHDFFRFGVAPESIRDLCDKNTWTAEKARPISLLIYPCRAFSEWFQWTAGSLALFEGALELCGEGYGEVPEDDTSSMDVDE